MAGSFWRKWLPQKGSVPFFPFFTTPMGKKDIQAPDMIKNSLAASGLCLGVGALVYLCLASSMTLKEAGLSVYSQLLAGRVIFFLVCASLAAAAFSAKWFHNRFPTFYRDQKALVVCRWAFVLFLPIVILVATLNTPFWCYASPSTWERPQFLYGWPLPWKNETGMEFSFFVLLLNLALWTVYLMFVLGCRKLKGYVFILAVFGFLSVVGAVDGGKSFFLVRRVSTSPQSVLQQRN